MIFSTFDECNLYQNHTENLAFATRDSHHFKKYLKMKISFFQKLSAIDVWDYSFPEAKDQWGCFKLMTYLEQNSCYTIVMIRFREIASVRLPGNRFRRRHMSPKGIRPGTWSRRWTVNLVTAGGARRAVAFINQLFSIFNFKNLKFSKKLEKKIVFQNCNWKCSKNIPKIDKNEKWEKNSQHSYEISNFCQVQSISELQGESCICH